MKNAECQGPSAFVLVVYLEQGEVGMWGGENETLVVVVGKYITS